MGEEIGSQEEFWETVQPFMFNPEKLEKAEKEVMEALDLVGSRPEKVLDIPCGVGRHSYELQQLNIEVTGVDATSTYITSARESGKGPEFIESDMRDFSRENEFDLIINLWNSFGYFRDPEDDREVLDNWFRSLRPGGTLLMQVKGKEIMTSGKHWEEQDGTILLEEYSITEDYSWMENRWVVIDDGEVMEFSPSYRIYSATELKSFLEEAGFREIEVYGGLDGSRYDEDSDYMVLLAQKPQESDQ